MKNVRIFLSGLPTEYQMVFIFAILGVLCWFAQLLSPVLVSSLVVILGFLGTLSGAFLAHGASARRSQNAADLLGDPAPKEN